MSSVVQTARPKRRLWRAETLEGVIFALPSILGFLFFALGPTIVSLYLSFTEYNILKPAAWIGLQNYIEAFTNDELFWTAVRVTAYYTVVSVPLNLLVAFLIAVLLNQKVRFLSFHRTIWYMPAIVPAVANAVLWQWVFNPDFGLFNLLVGKLGIPGPRWFVDSDTAIPAFIIMGLWGVGGGMLIYLGGLQGIPQHLYEAVEIDGGGLWARFRHVTIPGLSPIVFFLVLTTILAGFQSFDIIKVMTDGGPVAATTTLIYYLYQEGFVGFNAGRAGVASVVLFTIMLLFTLLQMRGGEKRVNYA